jgi:AbrB family looped-hinge helix DNA binding protein
MKTMEMTTMSSKGQVVIPMEIREAMSLSSGAKLMVMTDGQNLLLKPILTPKLEAFHALVQKSRSWVKEAGLKKDDVAKALKKVRRESRH